MFSVTFQVVITSFFITCLLKNFQIQFVRNPAYVLYFSFFCVQLLYISIISCNVRLFKHKKANIYMELKHKMGNFVVCFKNIPRVEYRYMNSCNTEVGKHLR